MYNIKFYGFNAVIGTIYIPVSGSLAIISVNPTIIHINFGFFIILSGFFISLTIEVIQLLTKVGCFDVDDMILNTLGAALGYGIYAVCDRIRRKINGKKI